MDWNGWVLWVGYSLSPYMENKQKGNPKCTMKPLKTLYEYAENIISSHISTEESHGTKQFSELGLKW